MPEFMDRREAAALLRVSSKLLQRLQRRGEGPPQARLGRLIRYNRTSLIEWATRGERPPASLDASAGSRGNN
jgi:predicted DNA-binding transcriptional regulator AlpA